MTKEELKTIKQEIRTIQPKTEAEKKIIELVGKPQTRGQLVRNAIIGAGSGISAGVIGNMIEGKSRRELITPRGAARSAVMGVTFGAAIPAIKRLIDIEAAKRGKY